MNTEQYRSHIAIKRKLATSKKKWKRKNLKKPTGPPLTTYQYLTFLLMLFRVLVLVVPQIKYGVRSPKFIWAPCEQLYSLAETPPSPSRIWAHIRGRYWSAKVDDISLWSPRFVPLMPTWTRSMFSTLQIVFTPLPSSGMKLRHSIINFSNTCLLAVYSIYFCFITILLL